MIELLNALDTELLLVLNHAGHPYWDPFMWLFTGKITWVPVGAIMVWYLFSKGWREGIFALLMIVLVILLCDQITSSFFKPFFQRLRPSRDPAIQHLLTLVKGYQGGMYGFVSSHSANSLGFATFTTLLFRNRIYGLIIFCWALINAYTRIYLGVHFPGDVLVGGVLGMLIGWGVYRLYLFLRLNFYAKWKIDRDLIPYRTELPFLPIAGIFVTIMVLLLFGTRLADM